MNTSIGVCTPSKATNRAVSVLHYKCGWDIGNRVATAGCKLAGASGGLSSWLEAPRCLSPLDER